MGCESSVVTQNLKQLPKQVKEPEQPLQQPKEVLYLPVLQAQIVADGLFKSGNIMEAIKAYRRIIEEGYQIDFDISGVGNREQSAHRYQWFVYRWYDSQRKAGKIRSNVFDALSLCYNVISNSHQNQLNLAVFWYEDMLALKESTEILMGYANILSNCGRYNDSINIYNKVIHHNPSMINAYVCKAMIYEFCLFHKQKAFKTATQILQLDAQNMYALFILALHEESIDQRIQKLKILSQKCPDYVRATYQIGRCYGEIRRNYKQGSNWCQKCIQNVPEYSFCYNKLGVYHQYLSQHKEAMNWYFKACEHEHDYKSAYKNLMKMFEALDYKADDILSATKTYPKIDLYKLYYHIGVNFSENNNPSEAISWFQMAEAVNNKDFQLMNLMAIEYDKLKDYSNVQKSYEKCIELNPRFGQAYYNLANNYLKMQMVKPAKQWYRKAIAVDPQLKSAYIKLGNIYKDQQNYEGAIDCYENAGNILSALAVPLTNMGICYFQLDKYEKSFEAFGRAKEAFPQQEPTSQEAPQVQLSVENKAFLTSTLSAFREQAEVFRKTGTISFEKRQKLGTLINSFQQNFKQIYTSKAEDSVSDAKVFKKEVLQILRIIRKDRFSLDSLNEIYQLVKQLFSEDEEYFHIIPQLLIQYFFINTFQQYRSVLDIENDILSAVKKLSSKQSGQNQTQSPQSYQLDVKLTNFDIKQRIDVNLFKEVAYFNTYEDLYSEIDKANRLAEQSLHEFTDFVEHVRKRSNGIPYGVNMKIPKNTSQQFKVILRILQKMLKKQINEARVKDIISKIDVRLRKKGQHITLTNVVGQIVQVWTQEITIILQDRVKNRVQTPCKISDLVRGKIMFNTIEDLSKAIEACDKICHIKGYYILELDNRLSKPQTMDVVLKIKVKEAVCQFQLAMWQDQSKYHMVHSIYEIERSPLGCIFGSYLYMSKGFKYPLLANCKDIQSRLWAAMNGVDTARNKSGLNKKRLVTKEEQVTFSDVQYIINALEEKKAVIQEQPRKMKGKAKK